MAGKGISRRAMTRLAGMASLLSVAPRVVATGALVPTPAQVEGPFYPVGERSDTDLDLTRIVGHAKPAAGEVILVKGYVRGADGQPLDDALVDVWQANHHGRYQHPLDRHTAPLDPDFQGWGLVRTDGRGEYGIRTIRPGPYPLEPLGGEGWRCRHIHFKVSRPGFEPITTQMYFRGDPLIEQDQEIVKAAPEQRELLIADVESDPATGLPLYRFDIVLAGG